MEEHIVNRHNELIDPQLHIWGGEISWYLYLGGIAAGVMVFASLALGRDGDRSRWLRWLLWAPPLVITLGMGLLFLDLEAKHHVYRFYLAFKPASPMSWGAWILVLIYPATIALAVANFKDAEVRWLANWRPFLLTRTGWLLELLHRWTLPRISWISRANIGLGVALGLYTGVLLGTLGARPLWNTTLLAALFLASGLSTGAAFMLLFPLPRNEQHMIHRWDMFAIGGEALFLVLYLLDRLTSGAEAHAQATRLLGGDLTPAFWGLVVVGGLAVPVVLHLVGARQSGRTSLAAPILVLIGGLALRYVLVWGGQVQPLT